MDFYPTKIHELAKKHKKLFEKYFINPGGSLINEHEFYWVSYLRFGKLVGSAVISPSNITDKQEYEQAFYHLSKSSQLRSKLTKDGGFRANINMGTFTVMEKFLAAIQKEVILKNDKQIVVDCHETMLSILSLQDSLVDIFKSYQQEEIKFHEGREKFDSIEYIEFVIDCICEIDYIQFTQLTLQYEAISKFNSLKRIVNKNKNLKTHMTYEIKVYLEEFIKSKTDLLKSIKKLMYTSEINMQTSKLRHMEITREVLLETVREVTEELLQDLRFPILN
ncbi:hypothetical protein [Ornithinibacillus scapharcae]|uniref:hypothetical protein n=1 Tax=Ornithinibacillus scapharcae TaxID=1147159 RepID=UPI000225B3FB|nr:hypothetical protein [Ornithinibacillus scapharcae]